MKKILACIFAVMLMASSFTGCTSKKRAKTFGGTAKVELEADKKLIVATWKDSDLWLLTRPMKPNDCPETYEFMEDSSWGILEGRIIITEKKTSR